MKKSTEEEPAKYDRKYGRPAHVGYKGKVYNVPNSFLWHDGMHQVLHCARIDLKEAFEQARALLHSRELCSGSRWRFFFGISQTI